MPHVSVDYQLITYAGHHRRPRSVPASTILGIGPSGEYLPGTSASSGMAPPFPQTSFAFWSVSNGVTGEVSESTSVTTTIGATPTKFTAWYTPVGGDGPGGGTAVLLDAFLANTGSFVDDPFVDVTSNPAVTNAVDESGVVATDVAVQLHAHDNCAGGGFVEWIGTGTPTGQDLPLAAGTNGFSVAVYHKDEVNLPRPGQLDVLVWLMLIGGIGVDGGGIGITPGGKPVPIDPWGPLVGKFVNALSAGLRGGRLGRQGLETQQAALNTLGALLKEQQAIVDKVAKGKQG
jgi:hypothetical protein